MFGRTFRRSPWYRFVTVGGLVELATDISGAGAVSPGAGITEAIETSNAGTGALTPDATITRGLFVDVAGTGVVTSDSSGTRALFLTVDGTSIILPDLLTTSVATYTAGGIYGRMYRRSPIFRRLVGNAPNTFEALIAGQGALAADLTKPFVDLSTTITGFGTLEQSTAPLPYNTIGPNLVVTRALLASIAGQTTLTPSLTMNVVKMLTTVAGQGALVLDLFTRIDYAVSVSGLGALAADLQTDRGFELLVSGQGTVVADAGTQRAIAVTIDGTGQIIFFLTIVGQAGVVVSNDVLMLMLMMKRKRRPSP